MQIFQRTEHQASKQICKYTLAWVFQRTKNPHIDIAIAIF